MQIYKLLVEKTKYGYLVTQPDFGVAIDAGTLEKAISAAKNQIEQEGVIKLRTGERLPETKIDEDFFAPEVSVILVEVDIEKKFRDSASESVRKNISMPAWMDIKLRYHGVDASKLFQDAAMAYLEKKEKNKAEHKEITSVDELVQNVSKEVLDQYVMKRLM